MENRVRLKTAVVVERRDARTVDAMTAALVESEEGYVFCGGRVAGVAAGAGGSGTGEVEGLYVADELIVESGGRTDVKDACEGLVLSVALLTRERGNGSSGRAVAG